MAGRLAPINADVLDWAIRESGLSEAELSQKARIAESRLHSIVADREPPMTGEFKALAKALARPTAFFFRKNPPAKEAVPTAFRYPPGRDREHPLTFSEQTAMRSAQRWQKIILWLREKNGERLSALPSVIEPDNVTSLADAMRSWLLWSIDEQRAATSASAVLRALRLRIEEHGVLVLQSSIGKDSCRGFSLPNANTPVIVLNSAYNPQARVFTLMHEVGHLMRGDMSVCGDPRDDKIERLCERAAATFLMPRAHVIDYLDRWIKVVKVDDVSHVRRVANYYRVSLRAAAIRLAEIGRAAPGLYDKVQAVGFGDFDTAGFNPNAERQTTATIRVRELGMGVPRALISAHQNGLMSDVEIRRYLDVDKSQLQDIKNLISDSAIEA
ncbi:ImmA/IrrE family metallo-endopeptidase [Streptomyces iakyrus]|uniref:ImmA/IrrE family metallo-endopeptidase n=1 Tax=Streptomyces iakyrus TaxID=68219 RepID=UPI0036E82902